MKKLVLSFLLLISVAIGAGAWFDEGGGASVLRTFAAANLTNPFGKIAAEYTSSGDILLELYNMATFGGSPGVMAFYGKSFGGAKTLGPSLEWTSANLTIKINNQAYMDFDNPSAIRVYQNMALQSGKLLSVTEPIMLPSKTKAQLQALAGGSVGNQYFCSDCTTDAVVVSTGTGIGAFARLTARTTAIQ